MEALEVSKPGAARAEDIPTTSGESETGADEAVFPDEEALAVDEAVDEAPLVVTEVDSAGEGVAGGGGEEGFEELGAFVFAR